MAHARAPGNLWSSASAENRSALCVRNGAKPARRWRNAMQCMTTPWQVVVVAEAAQHDTARGGSDDLQAAQAYALFQRVKRGVYFGSLLPLLRIVESAECQIQMYTSLHPPPSSPSHNTHTHRYRPTYPAQPHHRSNVPNSRVLRQQWKPRSAGAEWETLHSIQAVQAQGCARVVFLPLTAGAVNEGDSAAARTSALSACTLQPNVRPTFEQSTPRAANPRLLRTPRYFDGRWGRDAHGC